MTPSKKEIFTMKPRKHLYRCGIPAILIAFFLCSCVTLDYRGMQARFEQAVQIDNGKSASAFTETTVFTEPGYDDVLVQLTPEYIKDLDERLRSNALLLRAVSQWRTGKLKEARNSADMGLLDPHLQKQSRDHVLLLMIPGLVIDMENEKAWKETGKKYTPAQYAAPEKNYFTVFDIFNKAEKAMGPATPPNTRHYLSYQRWRVIQGWRSVVNSIVLGTGQPDEAEQVKALARAKEYFDNRSLKEMSQSMTNSIPIGHPLRDLIAAQSK